MRLFYIEILFFSSSKKKRILLRCLRPDMGNTFNTRAESIHLGIESMIRLFLLARKITIPMLIPFL